MSKKIYAILVSTLLLTACGQSGVTETPQSKAVEDTKAATPSKGPVLSHPATIKAGERFVVTLAKSTSGELVVWFDGKIKGNESFTNTDKPSVTLTDLGDNGVEVWYDDPDATKRSVVPVYVKVEK